MSNGKDMIIHLIAGLITKMFNEILLNEILSNVISLYKNFLKTCKPFEGYIMFKLIYLIMQQSLILKIQQKLIHLN